MKHDWFVNEETVKNVKVARPEMMAFKVCGCWVLMEKKEKIVMTSKDSKGTWRVWLQQAPDSTTFIELLFDACIDLQKNGKPNLSKSGNPYLGLLYAPTSTPKDNKAFDQWKKAPGQERYRYSRTVDCMRLAAGMFPGCGVTIEQMADGLARYDDLVPWIKAWSQGKVLDKKFQIVEKYVPDDPWKAFRASENVQRDPDLPWSMDEVPFK